MLKYLEYKVYGSLERNTPVEYPGELKGMADGAGISFFSDLTRSINPGEPTYFRAAALFYRRLGKYQEAEKALVLALYNQALATMPSKTDSPLDKVNPVILWYARQGKTAPFTLDRIKEAPLKFHPATNFE